MAQVSKKPGPKLACEITPERVIAARATDDGAGLDAYTARVLAAGAVIPRLGEENIVNAELVKQTISDALGTIGARTHDIVAILPDGSVRIALLEFDALPDKKQEADAVVRFRLKKALPFDVDRANVSYDVQQVNGKIQVIAAVVLSTVLNEYETVFRELGYAPGIVIPSTLASLGNVDTSEPVLVIKVDVATTTLAIVGDGQLLLFRTLDNQEGVAITAEQLLPDVHASLVFFQDTYNMRVTRILLGGMVDADALGGILEEQTGVDVRNLVAARHLGSSRPNFPASALAGVAGALLG